MTKSPYASPPYQSELRAALVRLSGHLRKTLICSAVVNLLQLASTFYMLETYGRVVNSRNPKTLLMLTLMVLLAYAMMQVFDWVRERLLLQAANKLDQELGERVFNATFEAQLRGLPVGLQPLADLRAIRNFLSGSALMAMIDTPMALVFILIVFVISAPLGTFCLVAALLMAGIGIYTERKTHLPLTAAQRSGVEAQRYANASLQNAQVIESMGMWPAIRTRWLRRQKQMLAEQAEASDHAGTGADMSKALQVLQNYLVLGIAAMLTIEGHLEAGGSAMIIAWTLSGKALGPLQMVIMHSKQIAAIRDTWARLNNILDQLPARNAGMPLPAPRGALSVESLAAGAPNSPIAILRGVNFSLMPGEALAVVGPSAAGKSTLGRLLVGLWPAASGRVRLDGVDIYAWNKQELGPYIGYLPQDNELFDGTLAENIARFGRGDEHLLRKAVSAVGLDELVAALPNGFETLIGAGGVVLSGGQRQRVALARAIYGDPNFIVLDEPNSSLDEAGEHALLQTLVGMKARGATAVVITHRTSVLAAIDKILVLRDGQAAAFGGRDEVLAALQGRPAAPPATPPAALEGGAV
jgi:ATP-binding cassette subfamily C exporter for protease/lipase